MSAVGGPEVIRVDTAPSVPVPPQGGVLIEVEASSLAFTDMLIRRNLYPLLKPVPPVLLGYDLVGVVRTHGAGVNAPAVGTRSPRWRRSAAARTGSVCPPRSWSRWRADWTPFRPSR
ncbi:MAG: alcohol dehydrogenase catalytic domain-containing protein [Burkholderiales bacterium]|nr:alcohol dehydrogenase catalytic domain-containing protein [Burkholderiales bacterium]